MPYPAPPPEPPPVIQTREDGTHSHPASAIAPSVASPAGSQEVKPAPASAQYVVAGAFASPTPPEAFAPEDSPSVPVPAVQDTALASTTATAATTSQAAQLGSPRVGIAIEPSHRNSPEIQPASTAPTTLWLQSQSPEKATTAQASEAIAPPANPAQTVASSLDSTGSQSNPKLPKFETPAQSVTPNQPSVPSLTRPQPAVPAQPPTNNSSPAPAPPSPAAGASPPGANNPPTAPTGTGGVVELTADRQEYDAERRIFTAEGNVLMRFQGAVLDTNRLQVNLLNRIAVAEGNVALRRGGQLLRGERFEYNFVQGTGVIQQASGEIYIPTAGQDFSPTLSAGAIPDRPLSDRVLANQPLQQVASPGGISVVVGAGQDSPSGGGGAVRRLRFEAERIEFSPAGWQANNIRITNDPFSPPELELRADQAQLTRVGPLQDEVQATRPRLILDQGFSVPVLQSRVTLDRRQRNPAIANIGFDGTDRGGVFVERTFEPVSTDRIQFSVTPQFFAQRAVAEKSGNIFDPAVYGLRSSLDATLGPRTTVRGSAVLTSLDFSDLEDQLRASFRVRQLVGTHTLGLEYSYRDRLFNGSLGFQDVQSSLGALFTSPPNLSIGNTGIRLDYQAGVQYVNADTDRLDLLEADRRNNRISLSRLQARANIGKDFLLWQGKGLPATRTEGLRYSPTPVVPYVSLITGLEGVATTYSSGDHQNSLRGTIGLQGQFGHFSRRFLDYTAFNVTYSQSAISGQSPFLFDRIVDPQVLSAGITQQVYGPFRVGFQTSVNLDTGRQISTDYILEYQRRTYGLTLRYNPVLAIGSLGLRISDFNWSGGTEPFSGTGIRSVEGGVIRRSDE